MNTDTITGTLVASYEEADAHGPGAFYPHPDGDHFCVYVPGDAMVRCLPVGKDRGWKWDGNAAAPTLEPSIFAYDADNNPVWHGFLRAGIFESC